jgi:hypothetical protein
VFYQSLLPSLSNLQLWNRTQLIHPR